LLEFIQEQRFEHVGAFTYSPQVGTPAGVMESQVPEALKVERYGRVMELAQAISHEANQSVVGQQLQVLVESTSSVESAGGDLVVVGRTYRDAPEVDGLAFVKGEFAAGSLVMARVDGALPYDLLCSPVDSA